LQQLTEQRKADKIVARFKYAASGGKPIRDLQGGGSHASGILSANRLFCPRVFAALWYKQRFAFYYSLEEIRTTD
jgi:hypothetical protein